MLWYFQKTREGLIGEDKREAEECRRGEMTMRRGIQK